MDKNNSIVNKIKGIIFDFDGTIADTNINPTTLSKWRDELKLDCEYYQILETIEQLKPTERRQKTSEIEALELEAILNAKMLEGFELWMDFIEYKELKVAVFSRNLRRNMEIFFDKRNFTFDIMIGREDAKAKPNPEGIHIILDKLCLNATETMIIGDDPIIDIQCGKKAQIKTALLSNKSTLFSNEQKPDFIWANLSTGLKEIKEGIFFNT